ncbi:MAG: hypothetical protein AB7U78_25800 [Hyphomicrobiaceae bacterium]
MRIAKNVLALSTLGLLALSIPGALAATPEERAKCEEMMKKMGAEAPHDHGKEKTGAPNAMTSEHMHCKDVLAEPHQGHKDGDKHDQK